jgi:putative ABC transport system permease protein
MDTLLQDLRYGLRILTKSRASTAIAVLTLALGIGATTAIFSVVECAVFDAFPWADVHHIVLMVVHDTRFGADSRSAMISGPELLDYQKENHVFDVVFGQSFLAVLMTGSGGPLEFSGSPVTSDFFRGLGVPPLAGRSLGPADNNPGAPPVAVLAYDAWRNKFNSDPKIVGKTLTLNQEPTTIVGVMPKRFNPFIPDIFLPARLSEAKPPERPQYFVLYAHLKPGVTLEQAQSEVAVLSNRFAKLYPRDHPKQLSFTVERQAEAGAGAQTRALYFFLGAVCLLQLIACVNVANLLLARATTREKEIAIRTSLGASRGRLIRQVLVESLLVALAGAMLGCLLAWGLLAGIVAMVPPGVYFWPSEAVMRINGPVLLFNVGLAFVSTLLIGLVPALHAAGKSEQDPLKESGQRVGESRARHRLRNVLVANEVALALVLLTGAGLLIRTFFAMSHVVLGCNPENVLSAMIELPKEQYKTPDQRNQFHRELLGRVRAIPGVRSAALGFAPFLGGGNSPIEIAGQPASETLRARANLGSDNYFETMQIPLIHGRTISEDDFANGRKVAVVNRTFVSKFLGPGDQLGKRVKLKALEAGPLAIKDPWFEIVGVTADVRNNGLDAQPEPEICVPYTVVGLPGDSLLVRTTGDPAHFVNAVRHEVVGINHDLPLSTSQPLMDLLNRFQLAQPRFMTTIMAAFATLGLLLVSIGVYSVLSYSVAQRTQEIGVRMALGAQATQVGWMVVLASLKWVALGIAIGVPASVGLVKLLQGRIWALKSSDPLTLAAVAAVLIAVGLVASCLPARRATKVDPIVALRYE